ncbi:hypothetical protein COV17_03715 [Candidatus Woesearchaeota archaeon CG10_big_fil_rev_8_21_14_0_10_36_11]|nr:MAG: hypothetical protein COV17_03715 [Candidatus Woesearchaeota archaeon CG10_big_fil_rev_8_21_14_0_10_36_11]
MNKEDSWQECLETSSSLKVSPDKAKVNSLIDTALGRNNFLETNKVTEDNANYLFEGYYSSLQEILHAIILSQGYKVMNHLCLGYYIRDVLMREDLFRKFDNCRFKRNSLIYYGRKMEFSIAKKTIKECKNLIKELNNFLE